jgi:hypothetical protein
MAFVLVEVLVLLGVPVIILLLFYSTVLGRLGSFGEGRQYKRTARNAESALDVLFFGVISSTFPAKVA